MIEYLFDESLFVWEMPEPNSGGKYGFGKDNGHLVNGSSRSRSYLCLGPGNSCFCRD